MQPCCRVLFGVLGNSRFTDYIDLDLSRIIHFSFDPLSDLTSNEHHFFIVDLLRLYHDTNLTACLYSKGFLNALVGRADLLKLLEAFLSTLLRKVQPQDDEL